MGESAATAVPVREAEAVPPGVPETCTLADLAPALVGEKVTARVQTSSAEAVRANATVLLPGAAISPASSAT